MRHFVSAACGLWLGCAAAVGAEPAESVVVVELYTSQGCSSCPPADDLLADLAQMDGVMPLALHVDYWDYLGWKDDFANPRFTERQKAYARAAGSRMIYTPQIIVGGQHRVEGNKPGDVISAVSAHLAEPDPVALQVWRNGDSLTIRAEPAAGLPGPFRVQLVRYDAEQTVDIRGGENAGRTVTYRNIVTDWQVLGDWPGQAPLEMTAPLGASDAAVVIVQQSGPATIAAAARLD